MKRNQLFVGLVFIVGCATGAGVRELVAKAHAQAQPTTVYQYMTVDLNLSNNFNPSSEKQLLELNRLGRSGWRVAMKFGSTEYLLEKPFSYLPPTPSAPPAKP